MSKFIFLFSISFLLFSCSPKVIHFINEEASFGSYESYVVVNYKANKPDISPEGQAIFEHLSAQISIEMEERGYELNRANPDLVVRYELISNQVIQENIDRNPYIGRYGSVVYSYRTIEQSALLVEITDTKTKKLIWHASIDMKAYSKKNKGQQIISEAVDHLFDTYLYRAKSNKPDNTLLND